MPEPQFLVYIATSLDGFIATPDGGIGWLDAYPGEDYGYAEFVATIGTIVIGRATYDQVKGFGGWPYSGKRVIVLSSRALDAPPTGAEAYADDIAKLAAPRDSSIARTRAARRRAALLFLPASRGREECARCWATRCR